MSFFKNLCIMEKYPVQIIKHWDRSFPSSSKHLETLHFFK